MDAALPGCMRQKRLIMHTSASRFGDLSTGLFIAMAHQPDPPEEDPSHMSDLNQADNVMTFVLSRRVLNSPS
jgi:hypothetical protein